MRGFFFLAFGALLSIAPDAQAMQQSIFMDGERELFVDAEGELVYRTRIGAEVPIVTETTPGWTGDAAILAYGREPGVLLFRLPSRTCSAGSYMIIDYARMLAEPIKLANCNAIVDSEVTATPKALTLRFVHQGGAETRLSIPPATRPAASAVTETSLKSSQLLLREEANDLGAYTVQELLELLAQCNRPAATLTPAGRLGFTLRQETREGAVTIALRPLPAPAGTPQRTVLDLAYGLDRFSRPFTHATAEQKLGYLTELSRCGS